MISTAQQARLEAFRQATHEIQAASIDELRRAAAEYGVRDPRPWRQRPVRGGAPQLPITVATLDTPTTTNTFTGPQSLINAKARGPLSMDAFYTRGAHFQQEAMGTLSVTSATTPTIVFGTYGGNVSGTITTALCVNSAITSGSGQQNSDWYYQVNGIVVAANSASSTVLASGYVTNNIAATATVVNTVVKNATPPSAVTLDLSGGAVFLDLKGTFSASSATNTVTTNFYFITSLWAG